jgi:hypothetical protein
MHGYTSHDILHGIEKAANPDDQSRPEGASCMPIACLFAY